MKLFSHLSLAGLLHRRLQHAPLLEAFFVAQFSSQQRLEEEQAAAAGLPLERNSQRRSSTHHHKGTATHSAPGGGRGSTRRPLCPRGGKLFTAGLISSFCAGLCSPPSSLVVSGFVSLHYKSCLFFREDEKIWLYQQFKLNKKLLNGSKEFNKISASQFAITFNPLKSSSNISESES